MDIRDAEKEGVRRDSEIADIKGDIGKIKGDLLELASTVKLSGAEDRAKLNKVVTYMQKTNPELYDYYKAFVWTFNSYIEASRVINSGLVDQVDKGKSKVEAACKIAGAAFGTIPVIGDILDLVVGGTVQTVYGHLADSKNENKVKIINSISKDGIVPSDIEITAALAALLIIEHKRQEIIDPAQYKGSESFMSKLEGKMSWFKEKVGKVTDAILKNKGTKETEQMKMAVEDVVKLLVHLYGHADEVMDSKASLANKMAALVLSDGESISEFKGSQTESQAQPFKDAGETKEDRPTKETNYESKEPDIASTDSQIEKAIDINKFKEIASKGFWTGGKKSFFSENKSCDSFFEEKYLQEKLKKGGVMVSNSKITEARIILFKHLAEAAAQSGNMECIKGFKDSYGALVEKIAKEHPLYFKTESVAKAAISDKDLLGKVIIKIRESLAGNGGEEYQHPSYWNQYSQEGMERMLKLRLGLVSKDEDVELLLIDGGEFYDENTSEIIAKEIASKSAKQLQNGVKKLLIPLNLYGKHWVGISIELVKEGEVLDGRKSKIVVNYMDSEGNPMPKNLQESLRAELAGSHPDSTIEMTEKEVARQESNDCGPETVENLVAEAAKEGVRISPEETLAMHSMLYEQYLIEKTLQEVEEDAFDESAEDAESSEDDTYDKEVDEQEGEDDEIDSEQAATDVAPPNVPPPASAEQDSSGASVPRTPDRETAQQTSYLGGMVKSVKDSMTQCYSIIVKTHPIEKLLTGVPTTTSCGVQTSDPAGLSPERIDLPVTSPRNADTSSSETSSLLDFMGDISSD